MLERLVPPTVYATILFGVGLSADGRTCATVISAVDEILAPRLFVWLFVSAFLLGGIRSLLLKCKDFTYPRLTLLTFTSPLETAHQALSLLLGASISLLAIGAIVDFGVTTGLGMIVFLLLFYVGFTVAAIVTLQVSLGVGVFSTSRPKWLGWALGFLLIGVGVYSIGPALDAMETPSSSFAAVCEQSNPVDGADR